MPSTYSRKRRRSEAFIEDAQETEQEISIPDDDADATETNDAEEAVDHEAAAINKLEEQERNVWESFREQHFEAIEQLPLTLHRQYTLLRELDEQEQGYSNALLPTLRLYLSTRLPGTTGQFSDVPSEPLVDSLNNPTATPTANRLITANETSPNKPQQPNTPINTSRTTQSPLQLADRLKTMMRTPGRNHAQRLQASLLTPTTPMTPMAIPQERNKVPQTTREMLSHIGWLSEEILRTSEEKVNLAQSCYDAVDRHVKLVHQAIHDQEASITLGLRPGTNVAPIALPELVVPKLHRATRVVRSPIPGVDEELDVTHLEGSDDPDMNSAAANGRRKGKKKRPRPRSAAEAGDAQPDGTKSSRTVKLTILPPNTYDSGVGTLYCFCQRESFGDMIACDNDDCKREWFHIQCVGLQTPPPKEEKWYCSECDTSVQRPLRTRTRPARNG